MTRVGFAALEDWTAAVFAAAGLPDGDARTVAETLVLGEARGGATHGVARIPAYLKRLDAGLANPRPTIRTEARLPACIAVDADNAMGLVAARAALAACEAAARTYGIGAATVRRSNHFGAAAAHTVPVARRGFVVLAASPASASLAPHGARRPLLGTNPFAMAAPAGRFPTWSFDTAASVAARGHVRLALAAGRPIPEGWALDAAGAPTTDPAAALAGTMLPFAGAKGSGLAMLVDVLGGVLAGSAFAGAIRDWNADFSAPADVGHFFAAIAVEAFMPQAEFATRMEEAIDRLHALPPAQGFSEVLYPGERSGRIEAERRADGIPLTDGVVDALREVGAARGHAFPASDDAGGEGG